MGNTANNNWPYPESTDLVKDGATEIENLADAIDTTLGVFVPSNPGLTLINTTSFSGVSSGSIGSTSAPLFTSAYKNYLVNIVGNLSTQANLLLRFRTSSDDTGANYFFGVNVQRTNASVGDFAGASQTSIKLGSTTTNGGFFSFTTNNPRGSGSKRGTIAFSGQDATDNAMGSGGFLLNTATVYDGFSILASTGNLTNIIVSVYGFNE